jgi:hypothetical protein
VEDAEDEEAGSDASGSEADQEAGDEARSSDAEEEVEAEVEVDGEEAFVKLQAEDVGPFTAGLAAIVEAISEDVEFSVFERAPTRRELPDYAEIIKTPMDLRRIRSRVEKGKYRAMRPFVRDFVTIATNAMTYNEQGSNIHQLAYKLCTQLFAAVKGTRFVPAALKAGRTDGGGGRNGGRNGGSGGATHVKAEQGQVVPMTTDADELDRKDLQACLYELAVARIIPTGAVLQCGVDTPAAVMVNETGAFKLLEQPGGGAKRRSASSSVPIDDGSDAAHGNGASGGRAAAAVATDRYFPQADQLEFIRKKGGNAINGWSPVTVDGWCIFLRSISKRSEGEGWWRGGGGGGWQMVVVGGRFSPESCEHTSASARSQWAAAKYEKRICFHFHRVEVLALWGKCFMSENEREGLSQPTPSCGLQSIWKRKLTNCELTNCDLEPTRILPTTQATRCWRSGPTSQQLRPPRPPTSELVPKIKRRRRTRPNMTWLYCSLRSCRSRRRSKCSSRSCWRRQQTRTCTSRIE